MSASDTRQFAVFGHPVAHSKSPMIHQQFAAQFGLVIRYDAIDAEPGAFAEAVRLFRDRGGAGCNVTVPFKLEAFELADIHSDRAEQAGAANTLKFEDDGRIFADNTDGVGLIRDITENLQTPLQDKRVLVLGAGGAVRGILPSLLSQHPQYLFVANRTPSRAGDLVKRFSDSEAIEGGGFDQVPGSFDVIINGTAASLSDDVPPISAECITTKTLVYDLMYADKPTSFMQWAAQHGTGKTADGLGMLVEQAAESFFLWHGKRPETQPVIVSLRQHN